jgi:ATP-dependent Clp protease ATP-binding subunit ClpA
MRLLRRQTPPKTLRPAERYLLAGAAEARQRGHNYVGTEHVLLALTRNPNSPGARMLRELGVTHADLEGSGFLGGVWAPRIDAEALAALGIDLEAIRARLDEAFGQDALERTRAGMLDKTWAGSQCVAPRLKVALEIAVERAGEYPVQDGHILLGFLSIPDSLAARMLAELGVTIEAVEKALAPTP